MAIINAWSTVDIDTITVENFSPLTVNEDTDINFSVDITSTSTIASAVIDWGDGTTDPLVLGIAPNYTANHIYANSGEYLIKISVTLNSGGDNEPDGQWYYISVKQEVVEADPHVNNVQTTGTNERFSTLTMTYDYYGANPEGDSVYQWYKKLPTSSVWNPIMGADAISFTLTPDEVGYQIAPSVKPVDNLNNVGFLQMGPNYGITTIDMFRPYDIENSLLVWDFTNASTVVTNGGSPNRITDILDSNYFTAYHGDDAGTNGPDYDTANTATFVSATHSILSVSDLNNIDMVVGSDVTVIMVPAFANTIGAGFVYMNFEDGNNYTILDAYRLGIRSGGGATTFAVADMALVDDAYRVHILRSGSVDGFEWDVDGVNVITNANHRYNYDIRDFTWGRNVNSFAGGLKYLQIVNGRITDAEAAQILTYCQNLP